MRGRARRGTLVPLKAAQDPLPALAESSAPPERPFISARHPLLPVRSCGGRPVSQVEKCL